MQQNYQIRQNKTHVINTRLTLTENNNDYWWISWLNRIGIGGRLFLALVLISSITIVASGLATNTYLQLSERLLLLKHQYIPGLDAAARLNDKSRLIVATAPLLVTSDSNFSRQKAMEALNESISEMDQLMRNLPDYNRYFRELITQNT